MRWLTKVTPWRQRRPKVRIAPVVNFYAELSAVKIGVDGTRTDLGVLSNKSITTAGAAFVVDAFQNLVELEAMNQHDSGTGTNAENVTDTGLQTPTGIARVAGTQSEPASTQYRTTATISYNNTFAITEHGIFSAAAAGTLLDRSVFAAINVVNGESIQFQYTLTVATGG